MTATVCAERRCPALAVYRGRCPTHRRTEAERGYGAEHRRDRQEHRPGAACEACGSGEKLQRDHRIPASLGGTEHPSNKRWLCRPCHDRIGVRSDRPWQGGQILGDPPTSDTRAAIFSSVQVPENDRPDDTPSFVVIG